MFSFIDNSLKCKIVLAIRQQLSSKQIRSLAVDHGIRQMINGLEGFLSNRQDRVILGYRHKLLLWLCRSYQPPACSARWAVYYLLIAGSYSYVILLERILFSTKTGIK